MLTREDLAAIGAMMDEKLNAVRTEVGVLMDEKLEPVKADMAEMKADIAEMKEDIVGIKEDITGIEERVTGIEERVTGIEERVTGIEERVTGIEGRLTKNEQRTHELKLLMENETNRAVGLVLDGHESLRQMIEGRLVTKDDREQDRIRICALEGVTKLHTAQIAELKKKTG